MIPKVIHYCWFGQNELPALARKCIRSWKKYLPDYEIKEWNEKNFDINICQYTKEAYSVKKYAFVSDYARFWILYNFGGVYFDVDVEIIKPMSDFIISSPFMGVESFYNDSVSVAPGLGISSPSGLEFYGRMLDLYNGLCFTYNGQLNLTTVVEYTTNLLREYGLENTNTIQKVAGITIYPNDYLNPKDFYTGKITITKNTLTIHHFAMSWIPKRKKLISEIKRFLIRTIGKNTVESLIRILNLKKIK